MAIKVYHNTDAGAPQLDGVVGSLISVLDAVLVNGYNTVGVTSIIRTSSTATVTTSAPHGFRTGDSATIFGATEIDYNADAVVTVVDGTTFTYAVLNEPDSPATGTISVKRSPAGFGKAFEGVNKAVYRSHDPLGVRHYLRILDDGITSGGGGEARAFAFESMTDVDTGTGPFPTTMQSPNGYYWRKSNSTNDSKRPWTIVSDGKTLYYFCDYASSAEGYGVRSTAIHSGAFGEFASYKPGDAYASFITGNTTPNQTTNLTNGLFNQYQAITSTGSFGSSVSLARDFTAVEGAIYGAMHGAGLSTTIGGTALIQYPNLPDSGFYMTPIVITQGAPACIRGRLPGAYEPMHGRCFDHGARIDNIQGMPGKTFMMVYGRSSSTSCAMMLDITGPWDS